MASYKEDLEALTNKELIALVRTGTTQILVPFIALELAKRLESASSRMCRCGYAHAEEIAKKFERLEELEKENTTLRQALKSLNQDGY